jgi:hypothetical protein
MSTPLRNGIHELVVGYLKAKLATGEQIDVAEMTYEIAQSLVDVIMEQDEDGHGASSPMPSLAWAKNICSGAASSRRTPKGINRVYCKANVTVATSPWSNAW